MVAAFLLAGWPVYRLTRPAEATPAASESMAEATAGDATAKPASLEIEVVCASAPTDFQIKCLDQAVLMGRTPQAHFSKRWAVVIPPEGVDLVIEARWPTSTDAASGANPAAARITVRAADGQPIEKSFWAGANGTMNEVFTVPGAAAETASGN